MMEKTHPAAERLLDLRLIAILRRVDPDALIPLVSAFLRGGIRAVEVTFDHSGEDGIKNTQAAILRLNERFEDEMLIGAGTVLTAGEVDIAVSSGAKYIVSPNVDEAVIARTREMGLVSLPGALTPTEIQRAHHFGAHIVKVFPAGNLGASYIRAVRGPLGHIPLFAVGGVDEKNAREYLDAGCAGIGVGGALVNKEWIATGAFDRIEALARETVHAVNGGERRI